MKPTRIDDITLKDHFYLEEQDLCFFFKEYTPREKNGFSESNSFIMNLKKGLERKGCSDWPYKEKAIKEASILIENVLGPKLSEATFVPVPPSKSKDDALYDDRLVVILNNINCGALDVRELIVQTKSREAMHRANKRFTVEELKDMYEFEESLRNPKPSHLVVFDDMLTSGTHFKAIQGILLEEFQDIPIWGLFLARRIFPHEDHFI